MCQYLVQRVHGVEESSAFVEAKHKSAERRESSLRGVQAKRKNLMEWVMALEIAIPDYGMEELITMACEHYNNHQAYVRQRRAQKYEEWKERHYQEWWEEVGRFMDDEEDSEDESEHLLASSESDPKFLARITTNYLRHQCTSYDDDLKRVFGKVAAEEAHDVLQTRINEAIHAKYP